MENFILSRKKIKLDKDKVFNLSIPVSLKPNEVVFLIESNLNFDKSANVEFILKQLSGSSNESLTIIPVEIKGTALRLRPSDITRFEPKSYLLFAIRSSQTIDIELSIDSIY